MQVFTFPTSPLNEAAIRFSNDYTKEDIDAVRDYLDLMEKALSPPSPEEIIEAGSPMTPDLGAPIGWFDPENHRKED